MDKFHQHFNHFNTLKSKRNEVQMNRKQGTTFIQFQMLEMIKTVIRNLQHQKNKKILLDTLYVCKS